jgi:hypothetical protein
MCEPITASIVAGALTVASTAANVFAQAKSAKEQAHAINNQLKVNTEESREQATDELFDQMRATRREQSRIRSAAGEAGLSTDSGNVEDMLMDSAVQGQLKNDRSIANLESREASLQANAESQMSKVQSPTVLGAGLQIASSAVSAWSGVRSAQLKVNNA